MTSHTAMLHSIEKRGLRSLTNPLLNTTMLCIEGTAAVVRGDIERKGMLVYVYICIHIVYIMLCIEGTDGVVRGDIERKGMLVYVYM
jgi:hypothetical protein